jgi:hypothetical protein
MEKITKDTVILELYTLQKWYMNCVSSLVTSETLGAHILDQLWTLHKYNPSEIQFRRFTIDDIRLLDVGELLFFGFTGEKQLSSPNEMVMTIPVWAINLIRDGEDLVAYSSFSWSLYTKGQDNDEHLRDICKSAANPIGWRMTQKEIFDYEIFVRDANSISVSINLK